ncbi:MAG: DUF763 domain-containing protein [Syntrophomonadaceae bacterium]|jgi:hypothetical protein
MREIRTGFANLPLHGGKCPAWLFTQMKSLARAIIEIIIEDSGVEEVLNRISNPYWFQALGCVVGFDWHSSGVTTTVCGALKEGLSEMGPRAGLFFAGGKGRAARNTPEEIKQIADKHPIAHSVEALIYASRMSAKIDNTAVQDGYDIYHHFFIFTSQGTWAVIQQGMNADLKQARRYHWLSSLFSSFIEEPHAAICCDYMGEALNLVSWENTDMRNYTAKLALVPPQALIKELSLIESKLPALTLPQRHSIPRTAYLNRALTAAYDRHPESFEELLQIPGIGPGTLRALCLVAEVAFGAKPSYADPVRYSFAHGGKDGFPFPVNKADIENSYQTLNRAIARSRIGRREQLEALRKLANWHSTIVTSHATPKNDFNRVGNKVVERNGVRSSSGLYQAGLFET